LFAFDVEYLLGRAFAGDFRERSRPEWPPHPPRLFSALAAAFFENGTDARERRALEWLEKEAPPFIRAGSAGDPVRTMVYLPRNYPGDSVPVLRNKQLRYFPAQGPAEATAYFVWPQANPESETAAALDALASRTAYPGKACSSVRMIIAEQAPQPNWA
jgi:CRISPR-associated protein Csb2